MPRKKHISAAVETSELNIHHRIARAAHLFTQEILHILGSSTLEELTALTHSDMTARLMPAAASAAPPVRRRSMEFLKAIGRIPVPCPVPGCTERGVRSKMNFCMEHASSVPRAEQIKLREAQKSAKPDEEDSQRRLPGRPPQRRASLPQANA